MASNTDSKGYDHQFVDPTPDELVCLICTLIARDPQQATCCGKVYCKACVDELAEHSKKCPQCREDINCFPDKRSDRNIKSLKCKCDNSTHGCEWEGELRCLEEHSTTCEYTLLPCPNECKDEDGEILRVLRKDMEKHKNEECPRRQYTCPHCGEDGEYEERTTQHLEECLYVEVPCPNKPNGCDEVNFRCEIRIHQHFCEYETVPCKYADIGCEVKMIWKDMEEHQMNSQDHLALAVKAVRSNKKTVATLENKVKELEKTLDEISTTVIDKQENTRAHLQSITLAQSKEVNKLRSAIENLSDTETEIDLDTSGYHLNQVSPNVLKFTNFAERKSRNEITYSPPFYSSPGGYKMCLRVYANGRGDGKDTHISLYVCLMSGENDDHLVWPFTGTVKIELLNQLSDYHHHKTTIQFKANRKSSQRVLDKDSIGNGHGQPQFISHLSLAIIGNPWQNQHQYLKDDCLYFRYKVTCEMHKPWLTAANVF